MSGTYRFYAAEISYFSAKVRPALRAKRVPYIEMLPTADAYKNVIRPRTGLAMIPVVVTPEDETLQDSSDILDALDARFPEPAFIPTTAVQRMVALLVEIYADEFLMLPGLHYRWSFPESETKARADFGASTGDFARANRFADQIKMFTRMVGVMPETIPAIEAHTRDLLALLETHLAVHPYVLGNKPSLADCALLGPLYPHLYLDAVPGRLLRETAPRVCHWIERMNHLDPDAFGTWLPGDEIAPTLRPLTALIGRDAAPIVLDVIRAFDAWADTAPLSDEPIPRIVGTHPTTLGGVTFERVTTTYTPWMLQRVRDAYLALSEADRTRVDRIVAGTGCEALLAHTPRHRVSRRPYQVYLDPPAKGRLT